MSWIVLAFTNFKLASCHLNLT